MINNRPQFYFKRAQSIVEYLLLLTAVVAVVLIGFKQLVPRAQTSSEGFYNKAARGIVGKAHHCGNDHCEKDLGEDSLNCCVDCGGCTFIK